MAMVLTADDQVAALAARSSRSGPSPARRTPIASALASFYQLIQTIRAAEAFRPLNQGHCPLAS
jgi:hypothetical protein